MRRDHSIVHFVFLLTRLIRCCRAALSWIGTEAPDFHNGANPYNRHLFKPALQVAQRALCFQLCEQPLSPLSIILQYKSSCDGKGFWYRKKDLTCYAGYQSIRSYLRLFPRLSFRQVQRNQIISFWLHQGVSDALTLLPSSS